MQRKMQAFARPDSQLPGAGHEFITVSLVTIRIARIAVKPRVVVVDPGCGQYEAIGRVPHVNGFLASDLQQEVVIRVEVEWRECVARTDEEEGLPVPHAWAEPLGPRLDSIQKLIHQALILRVILDVEEQNPGRFFGDPANGLTA